jgi:hypothetical protein
MEFGRPFLSGEFLWRGGTHFPYMPAAAMWFGAFALLPLWVPFALSYSLAIASITVVIWILRRSVFGYVRTKSSEGDYAEIATILLASHYIVRDRDDARLNSYFARNRRVRRLHSGAQGSRDRFLEYRPGNRTQSHRRYFRPVPGVEAAVEPGVLDGEIRGVLDAASCGSDGSGKLVDSPTRLDRLGGRICSRPQSARGILYGYLNLGNQALRPAMHIYLLPARAFHTQPLASWRLWERFRW